MMDESTSHSTNKIYKNTKPVYFPNELSSLVNMTIGTQNFIQENQNGMNPVLILR